MDSFMNVPVEKEFTYEDVINAYNRNGNKKDRKMLLRDSV